jgi:hypothetical protein
MDAQIEPNKYPATHPAIPPSLLLLRHGDNPNQARVAAAQQLLFPTSARALCLELGLNWWAAVKLYEDGWLSFSPETTGHLDEAQEAELRFVGSLVVAGCDRNMLTVLMTGLARPYAYDLRRLYYDWLTRRWRLLPEQGAHPEAAFSEWVEVLAQTGDTATLSGISELAQDALARLRCRSVCQIAASERTSNLTHDEEETQG